MQGRKTEGHTGGKRERYRGRKRERERERERERGERKTLLLNTKKFMEFYLVLQSTVVLQSGYPLNHTLTDTLTHTLSLALTLTHTLTHT